MSDYVMVPREELLRVARMAEALKRDCGMDPESPQAIRNGQYMSVSYALRALATPQEAAPVRGGRRVPRQFGGKTKSLAMCPATCGCLWINNGDGSMSLCGENSKSCDECENLPWASLLPVAIQPPADESGQGRGEATGDTPTFLETWQKLTPRDRAIISAYFMVQSRHPPEPPACGATVAEDAARYQVARRFLSVAVIQGRAAHDSLRHAEYLASVDAAIDAARLARGEEG